MNAIIRNIFRIPRPILTAFVIVSCGMAAHFLWDIARNLRPLIFQIHFLDDNNKVYHDICEITFFISIFSISYFVITFFSKMYAETSIRLKQDEYEKRIERLSGQIDQFGKELIQKHDELVCKRRMLNQVIDKLPFLIFAKTSDGKFFIVNKRVADCYGTHPRDLIGKTDKDFNEQCHEVGIFRQADLDVINHKKDIHMMEELTCRDLGKRQLWTRKYFINSWTGEPGVLGISSDVTELMDIIGHLCEDCKNKTRLYNTIFS